jgi:hypothetical protein
MNALSLSLVLTLVAGAAAPALSRTLSARPPDRGDVLGQAPDGASPGGESQPGTAGTPTPRGIFVGSREEAKKLLATSTVRGRPRKRSAKG